MKRVLVIGGGAAGIIAARRAAELGAQVTLLEKNDRLGTKILISGGGKCNLTHAGAMDGVRKAFRSEEGRFLIPAFHAFTNENFLDILRSRGLVVYTRPDGRVFPVEPSNAKDIVVILTRFVEEAGVRILFSHPADNLILEKERIAGAVAGGKDLRADCTIVATGGSSYPATGATGDAWRWMPSVGHTVKPLRAALAPLYLRTPYPQWSGVALRGPLVRARSNGKEIARWTGDLLFTHRGLSGPAVLGISREVAETMAASRSDAPVTVEVDCVPETSFEALQATIRQAVKDAPRKTVSGIVAPFLPDRVVDAVVDAVGVAADTRGAHLPAKAINRLVATLKGWDLGAVQHVPLERGEVVAGGVALEEVDPRTMASQKVGSLFLCGEVLDIAGPVGGYNLQAAWSTGYVAGEHAARG